VDRWQYGERAGLEFAGAEDRRTPFDEQRFSGYRYIYISTDVLFVNRLARMTNVT
jgi:hypothetical protein